MTPQDIISQTNEYRASLGLPLLTQDAQLTQAALDRANDMVTTGNFSHSVATTSPLVNGFAFMDKAGYQRLAGGENLARGYADASGVLNGWKQSETHNKNLIDAKYRDIGVAVVPGKKNGKDTLYVVQFFGRKNPTVVGKVEPKAEGAKTAPVVKPVTAQESKKVERKVDLVPFPSNFANTTPMYSRRKI